MSFFLDWFLYFVFSFCVWPKKSLFSPSYRFIHIVFDHILNIWYIHISTLSNIHRESPYNLSFFIPASLWVFSCYMQGSDCDKLEKQWDLLRIIFNIISATTTLTIDDSWWFSTPFLFNIKYQECIWRIKVGGYYSCLW